MASPSSSSSSSSSGNTIQLTTRQAQARRRTLLTEHAKLVARELKIREEFGPLALRWAREHSGLTAFFILKHDIPPNLDDLAEQIDGLVGAGNWVFDSGRWRNGSDIIASSSNPHIWGLRSIVGQSRPVKLTNYHAHMARCRVQGRGGGLPAFPWETREEAIKHFASYRRYRDTDASRKVISQM